GATLPCARVLVSCRISDWRGNADRVAFLSILPIAARPEAPPQPKGPDAALLDPMFTERRKSDDTEDAQSATTEPLIVQLTPLSSDQQRTLAAASGVSNPNEFAAAIERTGLGA